MKQRHQVKSKFYYIFWGTATVAVVLGQLYVGTGYRVLHGSMQELINKVDGVLLRSEDPFRGCLLYTSPSPRDLSTSRMPSSA